MSRSAPPVMHPDIYKNIYIHYIYKHTYTQVAQNPPPNASALPSTTSTAYFVLI